MTKLKLTSEQKFELSAGLSASDYYETVPFLNHVLKVLGYSDYLEDDNEQEELRWTKRKEPLIKDEKIRKAVRAWAKATGTTSISYWGGEFESEQNDSKIEFNGIAIVGFGDNYTIAELCGEEDS